jgi:3-methyladenine DNA glycosylase/8-oxoguanine DNA glycosylase
MTAARADATADVALEVPLDFVRSFSGWRTGYGDPTCDLDTDRVAKAVRIGGAPHVVELARDGGRLVARAWGPRASELASRVRELAGLDDPSESFAPTHAGLAGLARTHRGIRFGRAPSLVEALTRVVLQQQVRTRDAMRSWSAIVKRWGEPAPGPYELYAPPEPRALASQPYFAFHPLGVEQRRADLVRLVSARAKRIEALTALPVAEARAKLGTIRGIGPWTLALVSSTVFADADAVPTGDYHLPNTVAWALAGEPRADDARMLELLEPYRGHRARVIRLLHAGGPHAPAFGPKMGPPHWASTSASTRRGGAHGRERDRLAADERAAERFDVIRADGSAAGGERFADEALLRARELAVEDRADGEDL